MEHDNTKDKSAGVTCDLKGKKCTPCIASKLMIVLLIGYALFQFFGS
jgi:hypothetical protein